jgi:hypothetical protein
VRQVRKARATRSVRGARGPAAAMVLAFLPVHACGRVAEVTPDAGRQGDAAGGNGAGGSGGASGTVQSGSAGAIATAGGHDTGGAAGGQIFTIPEGDGGSEATCTDYAATVEIEFRAVTDAGAREGGPSDAGAPSCGVPLPGLPAPNVFVPNRVNVQFMSGMDAQNIPSVTSASDCGPVEPESLAWYYDDPGNPGRIEFCPLSCVKLEEQSTRFVMVSFGCPHHWPGGP